jgi:hypothetical protein
VSRTIPAEAFDIVCIVTEEPETDDFRDTVLGPLDRPLLQFDLRLL